MSAADIDIVKRIYGFNWAAVGPREVGFEELASVVSPDFESQMSPKLGGRVISGIAELRDFAIALEQDFSELRYDPEDFVDAGDGHVVVSGQLNGVGRASRMPLGGEFCHLWTIADGLATTVRVYLERDEALAAAKAA